MMSGDLYYVPLLDLLKIYDDCTVRNLDCDKCPLSKIWTETEDCRAELKDEVGMRLMEIMK